LYIVWSCSDYNAPEIIKVMTTNEDENLSGPMNLTWKRIMVVDDDEIGREQILRMLKDTGATIDVAESGYEAVRRFAGMKYDLVLMDLHMPIMNGYKAARNIRDLPLLWSNSVPIIAVSAENSVELRLKCKESGINDHLIKPVTMKALFEMIKKWLSTASVPSTEG